MLQLLPQNEILVPETNTAADTIKYINTYIEKHYCENLSVDISFMNVIDACYVSTLCATKHFTKYPEGKINWKISSEIIRDFNKNLELGNTNYI